MERSKQECSELFRQCVQVLNEYESETSERAFLETFFQCNHVSNQALVSAVLHDCLRHGALVRIIVNAFAVSDDIDLRQPEENIYRVIICVIFFQLDSIGLPLFRELITSAYLFEAQRFLIDERHLIVIKNDCLKLYEEAYVDDQVVRIVDKYRASFRTLVHDLRNAIEERASARPVSEPTKFKPFNLTQPKPPSTAKKPPSPLPPERKKNTQKSRSQPSQKPVPLEPEAKTPPVVYFRANPIPKSLSSPVPVKPNVASVLKENHLFRKQEDDVRRCLDDFEAGGRDALDFVRWQRAQQKSAADDELTTLERKKLQSKISYEEAILAKQRLIDENREKADELKRQTQETIALYSKEQLQQEQRNKQLIEEVANGRDNTKLVQQKLRQNRSDVAKQYKDDVKQLMQRAAEEAKIETRQRMELIAHIRAMESLPAGRSKPVDLACTAGHGVHDEMSIVELRERLEYLKLEREREREARRQQIIRDKHAKETSIAQTAQRLAKQRKNLSTSTAGRGSESGSANVLQRSNVK